VTNYNYISVDINITELTQKILSKSMYLDEINYESETYRLV